MRPSGNHPKRLIMALAWAVGGMSLMRTAPIENPLMLEKIRTFEPRGHCVYKKLGFCTHSNKKEI